MKLLFFFSLLITSTWTQPIPLDSTSSSQAPPTFPDYQNDGFDGMNPSTSGFFGNENGFGNQNSQGGFFGDLTTSAPFFGGNGGGFGGNGQQNQNQQFNNNDDGNLNSGMNNGGNTGGFFGGNGQQQQVFQTQQPPNNFFGNQADPGMIQNQGFQNHNQGFQQQVPSQISFGQQGVNQGFPVSNAFPTNQLPPIFGKK